MGNLGLVGDVVVVKTEAIAGSVNALVVDHLAHLRLRAWCLDPNPRGKRRPGRKVWTRIRGDAIPRPHGVTQVVPWGTIAVRDRLTVESSRPERFGISRIHAFLQPLPLRPEPVDVAMEEVEQGIPRRHFEVLHESREAH